MKKSFKRLALPAELRRRGKAGLRQRYAQWRKTGLAHRFGKYARNPAFRRRYLIFSVLMLIASTLMIAWLGAETQRHNADQLINAYMVEDVSSFRQAAWPGQHTFLFKWPLFWLLGIFDYSATGFAALTVLLVLATVGGLAYMLARIERRPLVLGTLYLALASVLLLIPAQPYAGGLLPVNMAMATTRNLEYLLFAAGSYYLVRATAFRSRQFMAGVLLLALLLASDRLFLSVSVGGALLALIMYALREQWESVRLSVRWLMGGLLAAVISTVIVQAVQLSGSTTIAAKTLTGPYGFTHSVAQIVQGIWYAGTGLLTNFGANPAFDSRIITDTPRRLAEQLMSVGVVGYLVNALICAAVLVAGMRLLQRSLWPTKQMLGRPLALAEQFSMVLLWSGLAAIGLFVVSSHYYPVDARYLTVWLFAGFVTLAVWLRGRKLHGETLLLAAPLLILAIFSGGFGAAATQRAQTQALVETDARTERISQALAEHSVDTIVGDYWRVVPVKAVMQQNHQKVQRIVPLANCTTPRDVLTSQAWQKDYEQHSFAYLASSDPGLTDYPVCNLQQVLARYGKPVNTALIAGSLEHPKEQLLFYDHGSQSPVKSVPVLPISLTDLPVPRCDGPTIMQVVAHQDDDLLFMNPDLVQSLRAGYCVRTVYLTAGDAGSGQRYWLSREQGSEAAYSVLIGSQKSWVQHVVRLPGGQFATVAEPSGDGRATLIYLHLPDGNVGGEGFAVSRSQSLAQLAAGHINTIDTIDAASRYSAAALTRTLTVFINRYKPVEIRTQSDYHSGQYQDHSDHHAAGLFAWRARQTYLAQKRTGYLVPSLQFYRGYNVLELPANVFGQDLADKQTAFMTYAAYDTGVCQTLDICRTQASYGDYLDRQYNASR